MFYLFFFHSFHVPLLLFTATTITLSAMVRFTIFTLQLLLALYGCPSETAHWPASCSDTTIALNVLVAPLPIPRQNCLSCFLCLFVFHYPHLDKDQASLLPTSMECIKWFQRSLSGNPKINPLFLPTTKPHPLNTLTHGPPPMYWLGTNRWCLSPLYMLHFV